ncbi:hypothetical protein TA3x_004064 [Tundrisphaera sp. TA3]|uniref:hypothetical protein n=1 Tax=Tundrisphaera sp. TA3 TaxID=3435775 RepID=UPI003EB769C7
MSRLQREISKTLRSILLGLPINADIPDSGEFGYVLGNLEFFLPAVLKTKYAEWQNESLDGVWPLVATKRGEQEIELLGLCMIITSQRYTPIHLRIQIHPSSDRIVWLECELGENGPGGMQVTPRRFVDSLRGRIRGLGANIDSIDWAYRVGFDYRNEVGDAHAGM